MLWAKNSKNHCSNTTGEQMASSVASHVLVSRGGGAMVWGLIGASFGANSGCGGGVINGGGGLGCTGFLRPERCAGLGVGVWKERGGGGG